MKPTLTVKTEPISPSAERKVRKPFAVALTRTAWEVRSALMGGMQDSFDRPTPFTMKAFRVEQATSSDLTATVWATPLQARYLQFQIEGGDRNTKAFEKRMHMFGGQVVLPGENAKLNQYGNMSLAFIRSVGADTNTSGSAGRFFVGRPKHQPNLPEGVWARVDNNNRIVPVMVFAEEAVYQKRFDMSAIAHEKVNVIWESQFMKAFEQYGK